MPKYKLREGKTIRGQDTVFVGPCDIELTPEEAASLHESLDGPAVVSAPPATFQQSGGDASGLVGAKAQPVKETKSTSTVVTPAREPIKKDPE